MMSQIQSMRYKLRKFLPSMTATRYFSSKHNQHSGHGQGHPGPLLPPWIKVPNLYENPNLLKSLEADAATFQAAREPSVLMDLFERKVKPFLVPRCLLVERPMNDPDVRKLHLMNRDLIGHYPLYSTSLTLMDRMVSLHEDHQDHLLEMLAEQRVIVFNDWTHKLAAIECLFYDHGTQLAPQPGSTVSCTYKAESDASFHDKSKTATLAGIIWELGKIVDVQVNWGMPCGSSGEAECLAAFSVLKRGRDFKDKNSVDLLIKMIELVTDSEYNYHVLAGIKDVDPEKYSNLFMAVLQVAKQYDVCKFRWAPRETIPLADEMSRIKYAHTVDMEEVIQSHSSKLWGCPIFQINDADNRRLSSARLAKRVKKKDIIFPHCSYIRAEGYKEKLDALLGLLSVLEPSFVVVLVDSHDTAVNIQHALSKYHCLALDSQHKLDPSSYFNECPADYIALLLVNRSDIPPFAAKKALLIVFDEPTEPISYNQSNDSSGVLTIRFGTHGDENTQQVDPILYGFFHSYEPLGKPQENFKILTYNLCDKDDGNLRDRFFALADVVEKHDPDFICFQSITPKLHVQLLKYGWWKEYFCSVHLPNAGKPSNHVHLPNADIASNYVIQMSKVPVMFRSIPCSTMSSFSIAAVTMEKDKKLLLATCSLDGKWPTKAFQAEEVLRKLAEVNLEEFKGYDNIVLCGGMSWNDKVDGRFPLADGWTDVWEELKKDDEGFTCQLSGKLARADRVLCKVPGFRIDDIDLVGKDSSPTISEHLGLVVRISHRLK